jgi:hypothetical protein
MPAARRARSILRVLEGAAFGGSLALALYPFGFNPLLVIGATFYLTSLLLRFFATRAAKGREALLGMHRIFAAFAWVLVLPQIVLNADAHHPVFGVADPR